MTRPRRPSLWGYIAGIIFALSAYATIIALWMTLT